VASEVFVHAHKLENQAIEIVAQALATDRPSTFESRSAMEVVGYTMTKTCADQAFAQAGFKDGEGRDLVGVVELHDCFAANEVMNMFLFWRAIYQLLCSLSRILPWDFVPQGTLINLLNVVTIQ
jgi:hypothetical protein